LAKPRKYFFTPPLSESRQVSDVKFSPEEDPKFREMPPAFRFTYFQLSGISIADIDDLVEKLRLMERMQWHQIERHPGLRYEEIKDNAGLDRLFANRGTPDVTKRSIRLTGRKRLFGYRKGFLFYIVHVDPNHDMT